MTSRINVATTIAFLTGSLMTLNFAIFWAVPVVVQGQFYKLIAKSILDSIFYAIDDNSMLRSFAENYIYTNPRHSDFFGTTILLIINALVGISLMFYWQLTYGQLSWWMIFAYYFSWVGFGGRVMGGAYALAHKEVREAAFYCNQ